jgi:hypothetical protein
MFDPIIIYKLKTYLIIGSRDQGPNGMENSESTIAEGQQIYCNFVKPHELLGGKTPAPQAGLDTKR